MNTKRILLIGSGIDVDRPIINYLDKSGHNVLGIVQKDLIKSTLMGEKFDLIILDLKEEKFNISLIPAVKEYSIAPIMVLASEKDEEKEMEALNLGAKEYLYRPLDCELLINKINEIFKTKNN